MSSRKSPNQSILIAAGVSFVLTLVPFGNLLLLPLQYLNTHIHELAHALAALATGGDVAQITVHADGSGLTYTAGGLGLVIASAGYVGASIVGAWLILAGSHEPVARWSLRGLAGILAIGMILWLRGDVVGVTTGAMWTVGLLLMSAKLSKDHVKFAAQFLGVQQCVNALQALWTLLQVNAFTSIQNDALNAEKSTFIPAVVWALLWGAVSLAAMGWALKQVWSGSTTDRA